jgi:hypothetical protein
MVLYTLAKAVRKPQHMDPHHRLTRNSILLQEPTEKKNKLLRIDNTVNKLTAKTKEKARAESCIEIQIKNTFLLYFSFLFSLYCLVSSCHLGAPKPVLLRTPKVRPVNLNQPNS